MLHNVFLDGKCQIHNTMFPQAHTILKAVDICFGGTIFFKNFEVGFYYTDRYKVKSLGIHLAEENM